MTNEKTSATRGLATIALLKVNFDSRKDHIGMFEPFVIDAVLAMTKEDFSAEDVAHIVQGRHLLSSRCTLHAPSCSGSRVGVMSGAKGAVTFAKLGLLRAWLEERISSLLEDWIAGEDQLAAS